MPISHSHFVNPFLHTLGKLTAGSTYILQLNVTTADGLYGLAKMEVSVLADVTSCTFSLDGQTEYEELQTVRILCSYCTF